MILNMINDQWSINVSSFWGTYHWRSQEDLKIKSTSQSINSYMCPSSEVQKSSVICNILSNQCVHNFKKGPTPFINSALAFTKRKDTTVLQWGLCMARKLVGNTETFECKQKPRTLPYDDWLEKFFSSFGWTRFQKSTRQFQRWSILCHLLHWKVKFEICLKTINKMLSFCVRVDQHGWQ